MIVDFYAAAAISLYKLDDHYYTASDAFWFYLIFTKEIKRSLRSIPLRLVKASGKNRLRNMPDFLLKYYPKEKDCISPSELFSETLAVKGEVRNGKKTGVP